MNAQVLYERPFSCAYKRATIALGSRFYWTEPFFQRASNLYQGSPPHRIEATMTGLSARHAKSDAPAKLDQLTSDDLRPGASGCLVSRPYKSLPGRHALPMNSVMPPRIRSKIGTATALAALIAISALTAPAPAVATPTPLTGPGYAIDAPNTAASGKLQDDRRERLRRRVILRHMLLRPGGSMR
jgi:hypothetical protein